MSSRGGIAAACGCVGACVALFHFGRLARAARADVASVEDSIVSAEADLIAAGASTRDFGEPKQTRVSGSARRVTREARRRLRKLRSRYFAVPPPSLGMLGVGKLAAVARTGGTLFLVGSIVDQVVHRGLSVSRGTVRAQAGAVGAALVAKVLARTGATSLAMVAAITTLVGVRTVQKRRAGHDLSFAAALESLGRKHAAST